MRTVALVLVLVNLLALAWWQGWLDRWYAPQRDLTRVAAQVSPEKLRVVPLERLAARDLRPCREVGALDAAASARVAAWVTGLGGAAAGEQSGAVYRVRFNAPIDAEELKKRLAELAAVAGRETLPCPAAGP
ncbi:MAG: hypothetical protein KJZ83_00910 [Burkholderiaceae bacterium]|nr:hypothetical protein [Burkholderiaceae bacterium]